jgi:hypothetical protein
VTGALAFSATADVAIVKGATPASDRTWLTCSDGTARIALVHVIHDLPHLVVESAFGLDDGLWGTLAQGGCSNDGRGHLVAKAAVNAVLNRWGEGPDTPDGVRDRMRAHSPEAADLADRLDDATIHVAATGVKRLYRGWSALPVGGTLRLSWPLRDS